MIRFKIVEIYSNIIFNGNKKRTLKYPVRSLSLVPDNKFPSKRICPSAIPEIFWQ
jgi:hypothetical protein